jgi:hypothetical protein
MQKPNFFNHMLLLLLSKDLKTILKNKFIQLQISYGNFTGNLT